MFVACKSIIWNINAEGFFWLIFKIVDWFFLMNLVYELSDHHLTYTLLLTHSVCPYLKIFFNANQTNDKLPEAKDDTILLSELDQALGFMSGVSPVPSSQHLSPPPSDPPTPRHMSPPPSDPPPPRHISPSPADPPRHPSSLLVSYLPLLTSPE